MSYFHQAMCDIAGGKMLAYKDSLLLELSPYNTVIPIKDARMTPMTDKASLAGQFAWYATENVDEAALARISQFHPFWKRLKPGDVNSNYGRYVNPAFYSCLDRLTQDIETRQAIIMINSAAIALSDTKDHLCTTALQFLIRDYVLHLHVNMRSSYLTFSLAYDVPYFAWVAACMASALRVECGNIYFNTASLHIEKQESDSYDTEAVVYAETPWPMPGSDDFKHMNRILADFFYADPAQRTAPITNRHIDWFVKALGFE